MAISTFSKKGWLPFTEKMPAKRSGNPMKIHISLNYMKSFWENP
jgi:hypothetical protein